MAWNQCASRDWTMSGGLWYFKEEVRKGYSTVIRTTHSNSSKEMTCYSDFPMPKEFPNYFPHRYAQRYLRSYVDHFCLDHHIRYNTEVTKVTRADDYAETGRWNVESVDCFDPFETGTSWSSAKLSVGAGQEPLMKGTDHKNGMHTVETFDAVLVCSGHHNEKHIPKLPGRNKFQGPVLHTHDYRAKPSYDGKKILVVGLGNSAGDVAVELSWQAEQVFLSSRRGAFVTSTSMTKGKSTDYTSITRFQSWQMRTLPRPWAEAKLGALFNHAFDHDYFALTPRTVSQMRFTNDTFLARINCGQIKMKDDIKEFTPSGVNFVDGTYEDIDAIILGTGYLIEFPFLEKEVIDIKDNIVVLYKHIFQPDLVHQTLAFIGLIQPFGSLWPMIEMQARLATAVFKGNVKLPSREDMWKDAMTYEEIRLSSYPHSLRHTLQVDFVTEMEALAEMIGCKPSIGRTLLADPRLAYHLIFGGLVAAQYRLKGPGRWKGARETILGADDRVRFPLQTRSLPSDRNRLKMKVAEWIMFPPMWWAVLLEAMVVLLVVVHVFH